MKENKKGKIYLIPMLLGDTRPEKVLPNEIFGIINITDYYIVENIRTTRRFLKKLNIKKQIDELTFFELNKRTDINKLPEYILPAKKGENIGIISEAGCPGIADPGSEIVKLAHRHKIQIVPLVGPSSILLALMASGASGQNFAFNGYLPIKEPERSKKIKQLENRAMNEKQSQIFMETPYRNHKLLDDIFKNCKAGTMMTIATDITTDTEEIKTKSVSEWKKNEININKRPTIFVLSK